MLTIDMPDALTRTTSWVPWAVAVVPPSVRRATRRVACCQPWATRPVAPVGRLGAVTDGVHVRVVRAAQVVVDDDPAVAREPGPARQHGLGHGAGAHDEQVGRRLEPVAEAHALEPAAAGGGPDDGGADVRGDAEPLEAGDRHLRGLPAELSLHQPVGEVHDAHREPRRARPVATSTPSTPAPSTTARRPAPAAATMPVASAMSLSTNTPSTSPSS